MLKRIHKDVFVILTTLLAGALAALGAWMDALPIVIAFSLASAAGVFIFARPLLGVLGILFFLPFERIGSVDVAGMTIRAHQAFAIVTLVAWAARALRRRTTIRSNPFVLPLAFFLLANGISLYNAVNMERSLLVFLFTAFTIAVSAVLPQLIRTRDDLRIVLRVLFVGAAIVTAFGLFQFVGDLAGLPITFTGLRPHYTKIVFGFPRIQSTALEPLYFANYLLLPIALLITLYFFESSREKDKRTFRPWMLLGLLILAGVNFILTVARGGYIALAVMLILLGFVYLRDILTPKRFFSMAAASVVVGLAAVRLLGIGGTFNIQTFAAHVQNIFGGASYSERVENYEIAWRAFTEHPLIGIGPGAFGPYASEHSYVEPRVGWKIVNNESLELLAETGVIGFTIFLVVAIMSLLRSLKAWKRARDPFLKAVLLGLTAAWIGILVQYQTFSILYIMHVWVTFGLLVAVQNMILKSNLSKA